MCRAHLHRLQYNGGIPTNSRFSSHYDTFKNAINGPTREEGVKKPLKIRAPSQFAESGMFFSLGLRRSRRAICVGRRVLSQDTLYLEELGCSLTHLALAWVANSATTSSGILGVSSPDQVLDNSRARDVLRKLSLNVLDKMEAMLQNRPAPIVSKIAPPINDYDTRRTFTREHMGDCASTASEAESQECHWTVMASGRPALKHHK